MGPVWIGVGFKNGAACVAAGCDGVGCEAAAWLLIDAGGAGAADAAVGCGALKVGPGVCDLEATEAGADDAAAGADAEKKGAGVVVAREAGTA